jgi:glycosyltransferase involved in cell wall biosynthesis
MVLDKKILNNQQRIAFVQYGDFFEAAERFRNGGPETYFAQRYSVELVERLAQRYAGVMVIALTCGPYDRELPSGVRCIGIPNQALKPKDVSQLFQRLESWGPTTVVLRGANRPLIARCIRANWRVFPIMADSFRQAGLKRLVENWLLARVLNRPEIKVVANHQVPASRDLVRIGVDPAKVVPWDWPSSEQPSDNPAKTSVRSAGQLSIMYAGSICEGKGVGELIEAVAHLRRSNTDVSATIAGQGEIEHFRSRATGLGVADRLNFTGLIPHAQVVPLMKKHDVVVVPSRHSFPEGLPMAIYDALTSRSPLVVSDHPMFLKRIEAGRSALVFPELNSVALGDCLRRLIDDDELYARLSWSSLETWERLRIPVLWGELLDRWLAEGPENYQWLLSHSLANYDYV